MRVTKRSGEMEKVSFDKVLNRIEKLSTDLNVNATEIAQKVCSRIYDGVNTSELDEIAAQLCSSLIADHLEFGVLSSRIIVSNHHKKTSPSFSEVVQELRNHNPPLVSEELCRHVELHKDKLNTYIDYTRDYNFDYFGFKTLEKAYLLKIDGRTVERPQHMFMRVAIGIHGKDIKEALETYDGMSCKRFVHATPTLFNFGTPRPQGSSCFLLNMNDDSIDGIYDSLKECALISKYAGGIGIHIHNIRGKNSPIRGTNGISDGIIPMLRVFNSTARYVNQSGKRNGSIAVYLEPWHADIEGFLEMRKNHGNEEERARDLFYALWIPDLFMERVKADGVWSLMCPDTCTGLSDAFGAAFKDLYEEYETTGKYVKQIRAQDLWRKMLDSQIETGTPYMLYKDSINRKTNQSNLGVVKSSNLCCEITEYTSPEEVAVCNLASICLPAFVKNDAGHEKPVETEGVNTEGVKTEGVKTEGVDTNYITPCYDFEALHKTVKVVTRNLNKVIDRNFYPLAKSEESNKKHRPIGIGVQGIADVFAMLKYAVESEEAAALNRRIFETIYHASLEASMEISKKRAEILLQLDAISPGTDEWKVMWDYLRLTRDEAKLTKCRGSYSTYQGSPISEGLLQFDLWGVSIDNSLWNWTKLREDIKQWGIRNSLLVAPMPTASTSQIMGYNECFEPFTSNLYKRKTLAGEFIVVNKYLMKELNELGLWNRELKEEIIIHEGSIQNIPSIPQDIRKIYKTVWEIKQKKLIDMAADRGAFICQSQSMNLFVEDPDPRKLTLMHFYAWEKGLKTGMYYLRTKPKASTQQFTIDPSKSKSNIKKQPNVGRNEPMPDVDDVDSDHICESCSA